MASLSHLLLVSNIVLATINVLLHSVGLYILRTLQVHVRGGVQMIYTMNLSVSELVINIFKLLSCALLTISSNTHAQRAMMYLHIVEHTILQFNVYMTMFYITVDRLYLALSSTYRTDCTFKRSQYIIAFTWSVSYLICALAALYFAVSDTGETYKLLANYITCILNLAFAVIAVFSFVIIFQQFKQKRKQSESRRGFMTAFSQSRFHLPFLLVTTFILLSIIPQSVLFLRSRPSDDTIALLLHFLQRCSYFCHVCIYLCCHATVRRTLCRQLRHRISCFRDMKSRSAYEIEYEVEKGYAEGLTSLADPDLEVEEDTIFEEDSSKEIALQTDCKELRRMRRFKKDPIVVNKEGNKLIYVC